MMVKIQGLFFRLGCLYWGRSVSIDLSRSMVLLMYSRWHWSELTYL